MNLDDAQVIESEVSDEVEVEASESSLEDNDELTLNSQPEPGLSRRQKKTARYNQLVYENRKMTQDMLQAQKEKAELQAKLLEIENAQLKNELKDAYAEGDSDRIVELSTKLGQNSARAVYMTQSESGSPAATNANPTGEDLRNYFVEKFPWFQNNIQMTEAAKRLDEQLSADPDWQESSWRARLNAVGKMVENQYSVGRVTPATEGTKSASAVSKTLYSQQEWNAFVKINPGVPVDELRNRLNKIKKSQGVKQS